ncbi:phospholipase D-like domain-containing protein [Micromonospora sp. DT81.3]|uniref:phospholipase D-like domain-containing protein n=1 Tax=Micromonospora sp. DT81.3 TaxID=3416523 RepID=UPI003CF6892B
MTYFIDYLPVTSGNALRLYVDGEAFGSDLLADLQGARRFVFLTGLHFMADFRLVRTGSPRDAESAIGPLLASAAKRGVMVYLLVNQFWTDEQQLSTAPVRRLIAKKGELFGYLPETYKLFQMLSVYPTAYCRTDIHANSDVFATHHQKTIVIDDRVAYLGGLDLTYLDGDRWDTPAHATPMNQPATRRATDRTQKYWHDVHLRVEGPAVEFVRDNFVQRWRWGHLHRVRPRPSDRGSPDARTQDTTRSNYFGELIGVRDFNPPVLPTFNASSSFTYPDQVDNPVPQLQIVRSMPRPVGWLSTEQWDRRLTTPERRQAAQYVKQKPKWNLSTNPWERSAKDAYLIGIRSARKYIYLENQWVADEQIWAELATAAMNNRNNPDFRIVLMMPHEGLLAAGLGANQELEITDEMRLVEENAGSALKFGVYSLNPRRDGQGRVEGQIYVHSKILIVDDVWALIGSANAGGTSLEGVRGGRDQPDSELAAIIHDPTFVSQMRQKLWTEHLQAPAQAAYVSHDADLFRVRAETPRSRVTFEPRYEQMITEGIVGGGAAAPHEVLVDRRRSRIVPNFLDRGGYGVPPTLVRASFSAHVVPNIDSARTRFAIAHGIEPPAATWQIAFKDRRRNLPIQLWYRWIVEVPFQRFPDGTEVRGDRYLMRSLPDDKADVLQYSPHRTAYIGRESAERICPPRGLVYGRVLCRVVPTFFRVTPPPKDVRGSVLLEYKIAFLSEGYARDYHPDFRR